MLLASPAMGRWFRLLLSLPLLTLPVCGQTQEKIGETLSGPDTHESTSAERGHLFGDWGRKRSALAEHGVQIDLQYVADHLWNIRSDRKERLASWNRIRGTVDLSFAQLTQTPGLYLHVTGLWQGGGNLGAYLGTTASPSGMSSANTFRLDSWWIEKRIAAQRVTFRVGQFAGQDFYGAQHDAASFLMEPLGYAMGNLNSTYETYDPPSTPAAELRVVPRQHLYIKSMVFAADRIPYAHNTTGFVPQFRGAAASTSEIGWTPGQEATGVRAFDNVASRRGYTGLYQLGATFNPGKFQSLRFVQPVSGNYLIYGMASQALWRTSPHSGVGLDVTAGVNWTPADRSRNNQETTFGLRYNELLPIHRHNTVSLGYVRSGFSREFGLPGSPVPLHTAEHALELNALIMPVGFLLLQPVVQQYLQLGGGQHNATVFGFRSKVEF